MTEKERIYIELLVLRCGRGDGDALSQLVERWEHRLLYYIRRLVDNEEEALDILQETWLGVFKGIGSLDDAAGLPVWLYRIARNKAVSHLRKKISLREYEQKDVPLENIPDEGNNWSFEDAELVHRSLGELPVHQREVLTLFFLEDMPVDDIGRVLDIPEGTVKSRLFYAKRALGTILKREDIQ